MDAALHSLGNIDTDEIVFQVVLHPLIAKLFYNNNVKDIEDW